MYYKLSSYFVLTRGQKLECKDYGTKIKQKQLSPFFHQMLSTALWLCVGVFLWGSAFCDIKCPDGTPCPDLSTCCLTAHGYGCCPYLKVSHMPSTVMTFKHLVAVILIECFWLFYRLCAVLTRPTAVPMDIAVTLPRRCVWSNTSHGSRYRWWRKWLQRFQAHLICLWPP